VLQDTVTELFPPDALTPASAPGACGVMQIAAVLSLCVVGSAGLPSGEVAFT
jgi:hypothetical protein